MTRHVAVELQVRPFLTAGRKLFWKEDERIPKTQSSKRQFGGTSEGKVHEWKAFEQSDW
jgi:hypothetical protein